MSEAPHARSRRLAWRLVALAALLALGPLTPAGAAVAAASEAAASTGGTTYVVQRGDTVYSLARRFGTSVEMMRSLNGLGGDYVIRVGQRLVLPQGAAGQSPSPEYPLAGASVYAAVRPISEVGQAADWASERGALVGRPPERPAVVAAPSSTSAAEARVAAPAVPEVTPALAEGPADAVIEVTPEERLLLAKLVMAEAGNEPLEGQIGVAAVVINRVRHTGFPKTVTGVIQEPGQFKAVELGRVDSLVPGSTALSAVDRALAGEDPTNGALFFYNPLKSVALDFWRTRPVTAVIGGHNFAR